MSEGGAPGRSADVGPRAAAVILADGKAGTASEEPRAFASVFGRNLLGICVETVDVCPEIQGFVVVAPAGLEDRAADFARDSAKFLAAVPGRSTSRESVAVGVEALPPRFDVVLVHDVARPLASPGLFAAVLRALEGADAAVPQFPVGDTVKRVEGGVVRETIPREGLGAIQTPQGFRRHALMTLSGAEMGSPEGAPLDVSFLAAAGLRVATVRGEPANLQVRAPEDLRFVERLLAEAVSRGHGR
ncbi:MAG TPA: 2-C-methyl-D-erythritol 4-phosphate cytidylyltransferase [Actinomycetota bacterium]|jgi:2-C-methyl-D-erythritol 4-phosphate cytidylyltransferase|nr:2-C-methyl-D-erythritol 4-phosphate cytidylyltransferase [Actinomycetota bacterium]